MAYDKSDNIAILLVKQNNLFDDKTFDFNNFIY